MKIEEGKWENFIKFSDFTWNDPDYITSDYIGDSTIVLENYSET